MCVESAAKLVNRSPSALETGGKVGGRCRR